MHSKRTTFNSDEKIWYGQKLPRSVQQPKVSVGQLLFDKMRMHKDLIALVSDDDHFSITFEDLLRDSIRMAKNFKKLGLRQDDVIGIVSAHTTYVTHVILGCFFNATPFHPVYPHHEKAIVQHLFAITRPKLIFCEGQYYDKVYEASRSLRLPAKIYTINGHIQGVPQLLDLMQSSSPEATFRPEVLNGDGNQTVCIMNSSGTTGLPKAVCISNHMLSLDVSVLESHDEVLLFSSYDMLITLLRSDDVVFSFSPLDWLTGLYFLTGSIMVGAKRVVTTGPPTPQHFVDLVERYRVTVSIISPTLAAGVAGMDGVEGRDLSSLRILACVGGIMPSPVIRKLRALLKDTNRQRLSNAYGSTEFPSTVATNANSGKPSAVGQLLNGVKVKIVDDDGNHLGIGQTGEVLVYNGKNWNGYYGNPKETMKIRDAHNWFHTGDLGYFDEDGDLFIVDRKKDIMKYRGIHYSPHEIEEAIEKIPDVVEVCVFGNTNDTEGDRAAAAIVKKAGSPLTEEQVVQHVADAFEVEWKRLHGGVFFMDSLPLTGSGKVIRSETKKIALSVT